MPVFSKNIELNEKFLKLSLFAAIFEYHTRMLPPKEFDSVVSTEKSLSPLNAEFIRVFTRIASVFGLPKSVGEIYGLLFTAQGALSFDEIAQRTGLSSGSVSYGLRFLRAASAVNLTYVQGDRRDYYLAETELNRLTTGLLREKFQTYFADEKGHLRQIAELTQKISNAERRRHFTERTRILNEWHRTAAEIMHHIHESPALSGKETAQ